MNDQNSRAAEDSAAREGLLAEDTAGAQSAVTRNTSDVAAEGAKEAERKAAQQRTRDRTAELRVKAERHAIDASTCADQGDSEGAQAHALASIALHLMLSRP
ncbi:hypothetical protein [Cryptosporangium minutisporangium]|uniref:Uncharacterized protein n=1 Tax=Cryptosporangium minutisporangium TaxID=113569 RepID=A0ABP6TCU0_9ACTN